jgi:predicted dithiol-disulfide oxidoreductase (DUF899 family)
MSAQHAHILDSNADEYRAARLGLLAREKELTRLRDSVAAERRRLPWVRLNKAYEFDGPEGRVPMRDLFGGHRQLIVYHFMFGPAGARAARCARSGPIASAPCRCTWRTEAPRSWSCRGPPFEEIDAYQRRMGWSFSWYSSAPGDFNYDFGVSATSEQRAAGGEYNFRHLDELAEESPGLSFFAKDEAGEIFHTYTTYSRTPKGRDEQDLPWTMAWVRRHDSY